MNDVEITGKTLDEARQLAADELGVPIESVEYEVLEEAGKGFLGLGHTRTKIRAWSAEAEPPPAQAEAAEAQEPTIAAESPAGEILEIMNRVMEAMQLDAQPVLQSETPEEIQINIEGPDVAILIGRQGHTLDALQYLVGIVINRQKDRRVRVILDAEGYRMRHQQMLEARARELADSVKATGQEAVLDPLPARDRRIIHLYLAENPDVETYSEGDGDDRRIVISPRK